MKKIFSGKTAIFCFMIISALMVETGCKKDNPDEARLAADQSFNDKNNASFDNALFPHPYYSSSSELTDSVPLDQLVVWLKPGKTEADFKVWFDTAIKSKAQGQPVLVSKVCEGCDSSLKLLSGSGIMNYIQGNTAQGGKDSAPLPVQGEDGPVYHCLNFRAYLSNPQMSRAYPVKLPSTVSFASQKITKVAVLDTGLDTTGLKKYLFTGGGNSCIQGAEYGWNFIKHNKDYYDDDPFKHGTTITRFIIDQVNQYMGNPVEILPVKTHNAFGESDLFTILCAMAYASKQKVNMINASFGFYLPRLELNPKYPIDPNVRLLREFVTYYLTNNNILLVAAAGNQDNLNERAAFDLHKLVVPAIPYPSNPRDLDQVSFYPASLARDPAFPNVIAVTTVFNGAVSPDQNFSPNVVDIGVIADTTLRDSTSRMMVDVFNNPLYRGPGTVDGTSFATPIVTGKLCANYDRFSGILNPTFNKSVIWNNLGTSIVRSNPALTNSIKNGNQMKK